MMPLCRIYLRKQKKHDHKTEKMAFCSNAYTSYYLRAALFIFGDIRIER